MNENKAAVVSVEKRTKITRNVKHEKENIGVRPKRPELQMRCTIKIIIPIVQTEILTSG